MLRNNFNHVIVKRKTLRGSRWQTTQNAAYFFFFSRRVSQNGTDSYTSHGAG